MLFESVSFLASELDQFENYPDLHNGGHMIRTSIRLAVLTALALCLTEQAAFAQTDVQADPAHHKLLFENEHVRVVRATFNAGEKSTAPFDAKEVVVVRVKGSGPVTINIPYGAPITGDSMEPGEVAWAPAGRIQPENRTDQRLEFIVIEPKH